jgi:hypothetical protein
VSKGLLNSFSLYFEFFVLSLFSDFSLFSCFGLLSLDTTEDVPSEKFM